MKTMLLSAQTMLRLIVLLAGAHWLLLAPLSLAAENNVTNRKDLRLIPFPKSIELIAGRFPLEPPQVLEVPADQSAVMGRLLNEELKRAGLPEARVRTLDSAVPAFRLSAANSALVLPALAQDSATESYALEVRPNEIVGAAKEPAGLLYSLQTLCQLIRANRHDNSLPGLKIQDWPSLRWRCFQDDMTRGPSSTLETLKFEAALGAYLKLNLMTYYMEYQYAYKKHPAIGPPNGSLTPEELSALVEYGKPLHLGILGNQQSFGHFGRILSQPEYAALRETPDVLSPVREASYQLLADLYSEVCPRLPFPWFNVCCDETEGLGTGPARELAAKIGVGGVYVQHIRRVHDLLRDKFQKRMMMWGDIILQHPGNLKDIPKDTIMLTWGYDARANFESQIVPFAKSGYDFFVCPGVSDWSRILPDFGVAVTNIRNFVRDGIKHGAIGMINTDWEDDGEALKAVKWHADAWAAECAWNASVTPIEDFNRRIGAVLFGESSDHFGRAIELLTQTHRLAPMKGMFNARFWEKDFVPKGNPMAIQATASNLFTLVRPALNHMEVCRREAKCNQHVLEVFFFGARRMELIGQRMVDGLAAAQLYQEFYKDRGEAEKLARAEQLVRKNRDAHELMGRQFAALWMSESKPYALDWTLGRYTNVVQDYDALLNKLQAARSAVSAGQPIPAPEEIGLALPEPRLRRLKPREILTQVLAPEIPWADRSAAHRIGIAIEAGAADRFDLPVELELSLPAELARKPVSAFRLNNNGLQEQLLAQLDVLSSPGKARLVLILAGSLAKETEASVLVYLGATQAPPATADAVSTSVAPQFMQWLENNKVRLLLGPEGAHVYRWELKPASQQQRHVLGQNAGNPAYQWEVNVTSNRDLTMPGETGWAGFSDINPLRASHYQLNCKAHGPAMVEYECGDDSGFTKTIRLYGGASWMEVFLSEPTSVYWDFDNPKNFAADGPAPGTWLFSNGQTGPVGREADGVPAQVKGPNTYWGMKYNADRLALGLITPESAALHVVAPGSGAGGVGIEGSAPAQHFITVGGRLSASPTDMMNRLQTTLNLKRPIGVRIYAIQSR